jgi:hypothetical protein
LIKCLTSNSFLMLFCLFFNFIWFIFIIIFINKNIYENIGLVFWFSFLNPRKIRVTNKQIQTVFTHSSYLQKKFFYNYFKYRYFFEDSLLNAPAFKYFKSEKEIIT